MAPPFTASCQGEAVIHHVAFGPVGIMHAASCSFKFLGFKKLKLKLIQLYALAYSAICESRGY